MPTFVEWLYQHGMHEPIPECLPDFIDFEDGSLLTEDQGREPEHARQLIAPTPASTPTGQNFQENPMNDPQVQQVIEEMARRYQAENDGDLIEARPLPLARIESEALSNLLGEIDHLPARRPAGQRDHRPEPEGSPHLGPAPNPLGQLHGMHLPRGLTSSTPQQENHNAASRRSRTPTSNSAAAPSSR